MGKGFSIAGFVLGIVGLILGFLGTWFSIAALPIAIVGLVLSVIAGKKLRAAEQPTGLATAGLVIGIISVVLTTIFFFTCGICTIYFASELGLL
jgi:hypothetical protein